MTESFISGVSAMEWTVSPFKFATASSLVANPSGVVDPSAVSA
jgi:hypothetical protein